MQHNQIKKLIAALIYNAFFFSLSIYLTSALFRLFGIVFLELSLSVKVSLSAFFLLYFILMYKDLYSRNLQYYSRFAMRVVLRSVLIAAAAMLLFFGMSAWMWGAHPMQKYYLLALLVGASALCGIHGLQFAWIRYLSNLGYFRKKVLLIGQPDARIPIDLLFQDVGNTKQYAGRLVMQQNAYILLDECHRTASYPSVRELILRNNIGEIVIFIGKGVSKALLLQVVRFCRRQAIGYSLVPDLSRIPRAEPWNKPFSSVPAIETYRTPRDSLVSISLKRLLDLLISLLALAGFLPFGLLIALAVKLEDGGPIFYVSRRIGKDGHPIRFYKFRSMVVDAEARRKELLQYNERKDGPLFKMRNDPRITRVGRLLRKLSLDEIPQLLNVLAGDMSIVGPRPHLPEEVASYTELDYLRLECMPGIVGLPQIIGRNTLGFRKWVDYDLLYRRRWRVALDLAIMGRAVITMLAPLFSPEEQGY